MDEWYEILKELLATAINVSVSTNNKVEFNFMPTIKVLCISIEFNGPHNQYNDGLTKTWSVKVKNTDMLKVVLDELKQLEVDEAQLFLGDI